MLKSDVVQRLLCAAPCADERMNPVYDYKLDPCGPVYLNVGDGGNIGITAVAPARLFMQCIAMSTAARLT